MSKPSVAIIGGGAAGIMCACHLDTDLYDVHLYEKTSRLGRKLLVAGEGGFNLTYHEAAEHMVDRYHPSTFAAPYIRNFDSKALRRWLAGLGIETYVGTSKKVFPVKGIKPYMVVQKLIDHLQERSVQVHTNHQWKGWHSEGLLFGNEAGNVTVHADIVILAMGGGSWAKTGSDGSWTALLKENGIAVSPLVPSNCRWLVRWHPEFVRLAAGKPLKNIAVTIGNERISGEALITADGIEGGAIYAHAANIRAAINLNGEASLQLDLKPSLSEESIAKRLTRRKKSIKHCLVNELKISAEAFRLIRYHVTKDVYNDPHQLSREVKAHVVTTKKSCDIDSAISTAGGVQLSELDSNGALSSMPNYYVIGEMLDWDTRTGGYLLQLCFSMGVQLAEVLNRKQKSSL